MLMKRVMIASTVVIGAIALVGGGLVYWWDRSNGDQTNTTSNTSVTNTTGEANTNARTIVTREEKGDINVGKTISYRDFTFEIVNATKLDSFHGQNAAAGQQYVVLFMKPVANADQSIFSWIGTETSLKSDSATSRLKEAEIMGPQNTTDTGYLWFSVGSDEKNFSLVFSDGKNQQTLALGF